MRRLGELDIGVVDHLDTVAPGIEEIKEGPGQQLAARRGDEVAHRRAVVDDDAEMPVLARLLGARFHQGDELITHVDEGLALAFAAQRELEDLAVEGKRLLDVADLERDVVHADQFWFPRLRLRDLVHGWRSLANVDGTTTNMGPLSARSSGANERRLARSRVPQDIVLDLFEIPAIVETLSCIALASNQATARRGKPTHGS